MFGYRPLSRPRAVLAAFVVLLALLAIPARPASAGNSNHGEPVVTINPGGGALTDGTDGLRIVVNSDGAVTDAAWAGQDQLFFKNTYQYCCSAAAPMLNIGGTLYGEAGPGRDQTSWTDLEILSTGGTTTTSGGSAIGSGTATLRYTAQHGGRTFTVDRTLTYVHPNNFVTEEYEIAIPAGNTETVKLYQGGDTAPGSSDSGTGVMITSPVRTVYSVNPSSEIQLGYGEVPGETPFDGALAISYSTPYPTVQAGNDIGFQVTTGTHDAGIMIQWTIGDSPGTHRRAMRTYVGERGASLTATPRSTTAPVGTSVDLDLQILNTNSSTESGLGYTFNLPTGLVLGSTAPASDCGGTLTAPSGGSAVTLSGASVPGADSCLATVPVTAAAVGAYEFSSSLVGSVTSLDNAVGTTTLDVTTLPTLTAHLAATSATADEMVSLSLKITNPNTVTSAGLGYVFDLPSGLVLGSTAPTNDCGGTLSAPSGGSSITLSGASVPASSYCQATMAVTSPSAGGYQLTNSSASSLTQLANGITSTTLTVLAAPVCPSFHGWTVISDQVARLYQAVLGRSVDQAGHLHWTIARLEGASARTLADLLLTSTERANRNGTLSDAAFVDQLYLDALGRAAESGGKAFWVAQLGGGLSRSVVALAVSDSAESATRTGTTTLMGDSEALVCRYYRMLYDRSPETGGLAHWSGLLEGGATAEQLATALLSGPEAGALTQLSMADYVGHLYQKGALNRNADAGGRDYWAGLGQQNGRAWLASQLASQLESIPT